MGPHKQKWTAEEEAALTAGIAKHGAGKWITILTDPDFTAVLRQRSNVDLKDKWRNMQAMPQSKKSKFTVRLTRFQASSSSGSSTKISGLRRTNGKLETHIMDAIVDLQEPGGSTKTAIAAYIQDNYSAHPSSFKEHLSSTLSDMVDTGKLVEIKRKYKIAPAVTPSEDEGGWQPPIPLSIQRRLDLEPEGMPSFSGPDIAGQDHRVSMMKLGIDRELEKMRRMTPEEAAVAAAEAVAEAEAAIVAAEEAAKEAEEAEQNARIAMAQVRIL